MALNKQIWISDIQENFYPDDSFASKSVDDSAWVNNKTVHIPNAGAPSGVKKNRQTLPAEVSRRTDNDLQYDIDEFTSNPVHIPNVDTVELSYDKRQSVLNNDRQELQRVVHENLLVKWWNGVIFVTTGEARNAHTSETATGSRKKITKDDVHRLEVKFNMDNVAKEGRYLLLDSIMYADLLDSLTEKELLSFQQRADVARGVMGQLYSFNVMERSQVLRTKADGKSILEWSDQAEAGECAAGLAWQERCVSRANGEIKMFDDTDNPTYYGDIYSFLMRAGGAPRRYDKKGVAAIVEVTATAGTGDTTGD